jgi:DNA invertase Pin-like site-specific DNA recombinase
MTTKRAAIYCRVSTERQARDEKTSLERQEQNCRQRAFEDGLHVEEQYVVHDPFSGSVDAVDRKKLQALFAGAERGAFDVVITDLIDRTSRGGIFEFADICQRFLRFGVTPIWATDREIDLSTPTGQLIAAAKAWGANQEMLAISRRSKQGKQGRIAQGMLARECLPYGYRWTDATQTMYEPDPTTAPVVRRIIVTLAEGGSATQLMITLSAEGIPPPRKAWSLNTITYIARNPIYKGERVQRRFVTKPRDQQDRRQRGLKTKRTVEKRDMTEWLVTPVPALVDAATWARANAQLERNRWHKHKMPKRYTAEEVLLYGGFVRCAHCGRALNPKRRSESAARGAHNSRPWFYVCSKAKPISDGRCPGAAILCPTVDTLVWREACKLIRDEHYLRSLLEKSDDVWSPETQIAHYQQLLEDLDGKDRSIASELTRLAGKTGLEQIRVHLEQDAIHNAELRDGYQARLADAERQLEEQATRSERVQGFAQWAAEHADSLDDLTAEQRREILQHVHPTVFVARKGSERPRLSLIFSVTEQAAARLDPQTLYKSEQWRDASGDFYTVYVDEYTDGNNDALRGNTLDLTLVEAAPMSVEDDDTASRDNPIRMSARSAAGELRSAEGSCS